MMELALKGLTNVIVYFGNLLIHSKMHKDHRIHLQVILTRLKETNLKLKLIKCHLKCTLEPVLPPDELARKPRTRLNLARQTAAVRANLAGNYQINLLQLVHKVAPAVKAAYPPNQPSPVYEQWGNMCKAQNFRLINIACQKKCPDKKSQNGCIKEENF
jgi:hypothetical protein